MAKVNSNQSAFMSGLRMAAFSNMEVTSSRWFTPTEAFWTFMKTLPPEVVLVDVGTGRGDLPLEAFGRGFKMIGLEICGQDLPSHVMNGDGMAYNFSASEWALLCRPCHGGFSFAVLQRAKKLKSHFIYVGLPKNRKADVGYAKPYEIIPDVGIEGESLYHYQWGSK